MENKDAVDHLSALLNKTLRILISDRRMFIGQMKCIDKVMHLGSTAAILRLLLILQDMNIILSNAHEYREPSPAALAAATGSSVYSKVVADMSSRYVGLIVIPGEHVRKIEVEEFDPEGIV